MPVSSRPAGAIARGLWSLTGGDVVQLAGAHFLTVATSVFTYDMTGSAWAYALQQLILFLPWMVFSPVAGPVVDRLDRRKVMIWAGVLRSAVCLCYPLCRAFEPVLVLNFLSSTCSVFLVTARTAIIPRLCDQGRLLETNGLRTAVFGVIDLSMPAMAGMLMARIGSAAAFRFTSLAMLTGAACFSAIPRPAGLPTQGGADSCVRDRRGFGHDLREAGAFLRTDRVLVAMVLLYTVYSAGQNGTNALFYPYVKSVLHRGADVFGLSVSFYFGANLLAGALVAKFGHVLRKVPVAALSVTAMGVWLLYPVVRLVPVILALGFIEGLIMSVLSALFMTEIQEKSPPAMTGRIWGLAQSANGAGEVAGILFAGAVAGRLGPLAAYRAVAIAGLALVAVAETFRRRSRR